MMSKVKSAEKKRGINKPQNWDKAVSSAYLRLLGGSREEAAKGAGVSERSLYDWEGSPWWKDAIAEARHRWMANVESATMSAILTGLGDPEEYAAMARYTADRILPEMAPPKQKHDVENRHVDADGKPIEAFQIVLVRPGDGGSGTGS